MNLEIQEEIIKMPNPKTGEVEEGVKFTGTYSYVVEMKLTPRMKEFYDTKESVKNEIRGEINHEFPYISGLSYLTLY